MMIPMMHEEYSPELEDEVEIEAIGIEVDSQPIELYKVLKIANVVSGGGEAKYAISEGYVAVNGELEIRKRRKIYDGDLIEFNGEYYLVICDQPVDESPKIKADKPAAPLRKNRQHKPSKPRNAPKPAKSKFANKSGQGKKKEKNKATIEASHDGGRSRIHFG